MDCRNHITPRRRKCGKLGVVAGSFGESPARKGPNHDIQIDVPAVPYKELSNSRAAESSEAIRVRVVAARNVQLRRFFDEKIYTNAQMGPRHLRKHCVLTPECEKIMENAVTKLGFSARGFDRILKRIRTSGCAKRLANSKAMFRSVTFAQVRVGQKTVASYQQCRLEKSTILETAWIDKAKFQFSAVA